MRNCDCRKKGKASRYARVDLPGNGPGGGFGLGWVPGAVWYSQQSSTTKLIMLGVAAALAGVAVAKVVNS